MKQAWIVPGLCCCVALAQISLSTLYGLTPWKGGGFGMFSTIDDWTMRRVVVRSESGEIQEILPTAGFKSREFAAERSLPGLSPGTGQRQVQRLYFDPKSREVRWVPVLTSFR